MLYENLGFRNRYISNRIIKGKAPVWCFPLSNRIAREPYVKELSRHILAVGSRQLLRYSTVPLTTVPRRSD
jgi:hypothetical protein